MPKYQREGKALTLSEEQISAVFDALEQPYKLIAQIMYYCAARVGETCELEAGDIAGGWICFRKSITKTGEARSVLIVEPLQLGITEYQPPISGPLFPGKRGRRTLSTQSVDFNLRCTFRELGIVGASTHSFRRSILTRLHVMEKWSLRQAAEISGHKSLSALEAYLDCGKAEAMAAYKSVFG